MSSTPSGHDAPHACCHAPAAGEAPVAVPQAHAGHGHHGAQTSLPRLTTAATLHCLTGCAIGEFAGLAIGVSLGLAAMPTMVLATVLAYASGFGLSLRPLLKSGMSLGASFRAIWLGEAISIGVMEIGALSVAAPIFWVGYAAALVAGFAAGWPVNYAMLKTSVKKPCH
jgi:ABC-type dipeptide/oligopeptide/nickel transport system permease component